MQPRAGGSPQAGGESDRDAAPAAAHEPAALSAVAAARRTARRHAATGSLGDAWTALRFAVGVVPDDAATWNLMGVVVAQRDGPIAAQRFFRAALALDPTCRPAQRNLERATGGAAVSRGAWDLGPPDSEAQS